MDDRGIETTLHACEGLIASGQVPELRVIGFWRAVTAVKRRPDLVATYAERIARVDRAVFRRKVRLVFPAGLGLVLVAGGVIVDLGFLAAAAAVSTPWRDVLVLVGAAGLDVATHGLAHFIVGAVVGIRFTDWFVDLPRKPQPGFKIDYASYLRTPARSRAWMHAAGAIATKVTPFAVVPYALAIGAESWTIAILLAVGVLQIVSDVVYSVKASDWKKFRREMKLAG